MAKDTIVIYRKNKNYFDFNQFETLIFASWKINTYLKSSLTSKKYCNSGKLVIFSGGHNDIFDHKWQFIKHLMKHVEISILKSSLTLRRYCNSGPR